jgi:hypothetical protein
MSEMGREKNVKRKEASIPWFYTVLDFYLNVLPLPNSSTFTTFLTPLEYLLTKILKTFQIGIQRVTYILPE